ncbi:MAG: hypothetical protein CL811_06370 [Colwelliaceae bacterium]|nr:hypothetical protein [Colwelliaceae bacterium]
MRGNATVQVMRKKDLKDQYFIYLPQQIVKMEGMKAGNIVDFDISNPHPDQFLEKTYKRFAKVEKGE